MRQVLLVVTFAAAAWLLIAGSSCGKGASSTIGESCSSSGDCLEGRCLGLVCKRTSIGCASDSECVGDSSGSKCNILCGCAANPDCLSAKSSTGTPNPYCTVFGDAGHGYCSSVK